MNTWQRWKGIMKASPFEEKRLNKWNPPYVLQPKYDGDRCRAIKLSNGNFVLLSSEENIISSCPHLNKILDDNSTNLPSELDGELYCHGMNHELIHGIVSRSVNLHPQYQEMQYHIFDIVNEDVQASRLLQVKSLPKLSSIVIAPYWICHNLDDITRVYDEIINQGYEGIIVRNIENYYERKRSTLVMKFKPKQEDEYEIVGFTEEYDKDGNPKDSLGALICRSGDGNTFNVGTGFTADRRKELWEGRDLVKGNFAIVKYQHITSGKRVPRFPVFVEVNWNV
jgi:ATP-dependent DNA ligase